MVSQATGAVKWALLGSLLPRLVTPLPPFCWRPPSPSDFGVVAAAMAVVSLAQIVVELGMGTAVIQRRTEISSVASMALGLSLVIGTALYVLLWFLAPRLAHQYKLPELTDAFHVISISLILSALISIPNALLTRELDFGRLFRVSAIPQMANALVAVISGPCQHTLLGADRRIFAGRASSILCWSGRMPMAANTDFRANSVPVAFCFQRLGFYFRNSIVALPLRRQFTGRVLLWGLRTRRVCSGLQSGEPAACDADRPSGCGGLSGFQCAAKRPTMWGEAW